MRLEKMWHRATYIIIRHINDADADVDADAGDSDNTSASASASDNDDENTYLLVQRRSNIKDYCPGKLDPTPGGVVGFGEPYELNAEREMMEEMNIDVSSGSTNASMEKLFNFPYQDEKVRVWGGMFEVTYRGKASDIKMQPEEVSEVLRISISDIQQMAVDDPNDWMPDGLYAVQLYLQHRQDRTLKRRLLKGYSNGNLEKYALRPKPQVIFFDCDDCLYFDGWTLANQLTAKIEEWCTTKKNLPPGEAYQLYKKHGTALKGLLAEGHIGDGNVSHSTKETHDYVDVKEALSESTDDSLAHHITVESEVEKSDVGPENTTIDPNTAFSEDFLPPTLTCEEEIDAYLRDVHDLPIHEHLKLDNELRDMILKIDPSIPKYIFTASVREHAERCLKALGIEDLFVDIIDVKSCNLNTKHARESFEAAMRIAGVTDPEGCIFLDDSTTNIKAARSVGWRSFLVGTVGRDCGKTITSEHAEQELNRIHDLPEILPEIFL